MRSYLSIAVAISAIWLGSSALNFAYVPRGASGAFEIFIGAVVIWILAEFAMFAEFQRNNMEGKGFALTLTATIGFMVLAESSFWFSIPEDNNKPMLLRLTLGAYAGFGAAVVAIILSLWSGHRIRRPEWRFARCARWIAKVTAGAFALELAFFAARGALRGTLGYYAMDCAMFAIAALTVAIILAAVGRCVPSNRSEVS